MELGEVCPGDSIGKLIVDACSRDGVVLEPDDVLVIAQKIVSKSEGRLLDSTELRCRIMPGNWVGSSIKILHWSN